MIGTKSGTPHIILGLMLLVTAGAAGYALYPLQVLVEGVGVIQPVFETLEPIVPLEPGRVVRLLVTQDQKVDAGTAVLEYVRHGEYGVRTLARFTGPGGTVEPEPEPEWYRASQEQRVRRMGAVSRWSAGVYRPSAVRPAVWEYQLAARFNMLVAREIDAAQEAAAILENERAGHAEFNIPEVFDKDLGEYRPAEHGLALRSPDRGRLFSWWATPITQLFPRTPVGEVARADAPVEILGVVPVLPDGSLITLEQVARVASSSSPGEMADRIALFDIGRVAIAAADLPLLIPALTVSADGYFVRLLLSQPLPPSTFRSTVQFRLASPKRPRAWFWWMAHHAKTHPRRVQEQSPYARPQRTVAAS